MLKRILCFIATVFACIGISVCFMSGFATDGYETISVGETKTVAVIENATVYLQFVPQVSGTYNFYSISDMDTVGYLYDSAKANVLAGNDDDGENSNFFITYYFEADTVYYFAVRLFAMGNVNCFEVTLESDSCLHGTIVINEAVKANCTAVGYTEGSYCGNCGEIVVSQRETAVDMTNHTGTADVVKNVVTATCSERGYSGDIYWSCCDALAVSGEELPLDKYAHTGKADITKNVIAATCTKVGYTGDLYWSCCDTLAASGEDIPVNKNSHTGKADITKNVIAATCTKVGYTGDLYWSCCGVLASKGEEIPDDKNSHTGKADVIKNARTADCKAAGYTGDIYWSCCGAFEEKGTQVPKTKHSYGSYKTVKNATCISPGEKEKVCSICGDVVTAEIGIADHSYQPLTAKATLSKNGKVVYVCTCGKVDSSKKIYYPKIINLEKTKYTYNGKEQTPAVIVKDSNGYTLTEDTDYTVKYENGRKAPGKYTVKITFKGKYEGTKKLYFTIIPKTTGKITALQSTTAIKLTWKKVTGADGYRIYQYNTKTKKWDKIKTVKSGTSVSYKVKKLKAGTKYKFRVKAYTKDDGTIWGKTSATFQSATKTKTPKITKLTTSKGKAVFVWSDVSGESGYQVYYSTKKDSGFKKLSSYKAGIVKGSKSKLKSGKKYYFKVRAYTKTDSGTVYSSWSDVKGIKIK